MSLERLHPPGTSASPPRTSAPQIVRSLDLPLGARITSAPGRHQFYSVRVENGIAVPAFKASGDITSMSQADGYIEIPADVEIVEPGTLVEVKLFSRRALDSISSDRAVQDRPSEWPSASGQKPQGPVIYFLDPYAKNRSIS